MYLKIVSTMFFLISSISSNADDADRADSIWLKDDHFKISLATFLAEYESDFRISSSTLGLGTPVSFEDDLGLDDSDTVYRIDGYYRFAARHRLELSYVDLSGMVKLSRVFPSLLTKQLSLPDQI